jgi:Spy/CpxP family protein refolding chaperone
MKRSNLIRLAGTAAIAAGMAFAQAPSAAPKQPAGAQQRANRRAEFRERMMEQLNLTPAQKQQADTIFGQAREKAKPFREELRQNREALQAAIKADDTARIHTLAAKESGLLARVVEIRSDAMAKFYAQLTPAQKVKADQMHQQMKQRWEQRKSEEGPTR